MTLSEIHEKINQIEKNDDITSFNKNGIDFWPTIRILIYSRLHRRHYKSSNESFSTVSSSSYFINKLKRIAKTILSFDFKIFSLRKQNALFLSDGVSFVSDREGYIDRFCYPIEEYLDTKHWSSILVTPTCTHKKEMLSNNVFCYKFIVDILSIFYKLVRLLQKKRSRKVVEVIEKINNELGSDLIRYEDVKSFIDRTVIHKIVFEYLLLIVKPKIIFIVEYYSIQGQAISYVANKMNIKCIDMQHGAMYKTHPAYASWLNLPKNRYNTFPSAFYVWDELGEKHIGEWFDGDVYLGANIYLEKNIQWNLNEAQYKNEYISCLLLAKKNLLDEPRKKILVTLQTDIFTAEDISKFLNQITWGNNYFWLIRLHPSMMSEINALAKHFSDFENIDLVCASKCPLYKLLPNCDLHITHSSSSSIEAYFYGVKTILTSNSGIEIVEESIDKTHYTYIDGLESINESDVTNMLVNGNNNIVSKSIDRLSNAYASIDKLLLSVN